MDNFKSKYLKESCILIPGKNDIEAIILDYSKYAYQYDIYTLLKNGHIETVDACSGYLGHANDLVCEISNAISSFNKGFSIAVSKLSSVDDDVIMDVLCFQEDVSGDDDNILNLSKPLLSYKNNQCVWCLDLDENGYFVQYRIDKDNFFDIIKKYNLYDDTPKIIRSIE